MTDLRKAAEMAFAELCNQRDAHYTKDIPAELTQAIQALRQALAEPEQKYATKVLADGTFVTEPLPLYTASPKREWVGLTEEQIFEHEWWDEETAFAVNKELKEKNGG